VFAPPPFNSAALPLPLPRALLLAVLPAERLLLLLLLLLVLALLLLLLPVLLLPSIGAGLRLRCWRFSAAREDALITMSRHSSIELHAFGGMPVVTGGGW